MLCSTEKTALLPNFPFPAHKNCQLGIFLMSIQKTTIEVPYRSPSVTQLISSAYFWDRCFAIHANLATVFGHGFVFGQLYVLC